LIFWFFGSFPFGAVPQYGRITPQLGFTAGDMYKKKKVAALKHRRREQKLKERRKTQAPPAPPKEK
jgi:hypothetical protein